MKGFHFKAFALGVFKSQMEATLITNTYKYRENITVLCKTFFSHTPRIFINQLKINIVTTYFFMSCILRELNEISILKR